MTDQWAVASRRADWAEGRWFCHRVRFTDPQDAALDAAERMARTAATQTTQGHPGYVFKLVQVAAQPDFVP